MHSLRKKDYEQPRVLRVLIADDHPLFREALKQVLIRVRPGAKCVGTSNYRDLLGLVSKDTSAFDLIFVDLLMPGSADLAALKSLRELAPDTPTVVVSAREDAVTIQGVLACGVAGYIPKSTPAAELEAAIGRILNGGVYIPHHVGAEVPDDSAAFATQLTPRQAAVLEQLACGRSNRQIAHHLGIEEITVKAHISAIFRKLNVKNRLQAVVTSQVLLDQSKGETKITL